MHISKIFIEGFKSFKDETVICLQPGLNIVVGHSGAGKSNFLQAIQFVLSRHQHISQKKLFGILHSSAGVCVKSAHVEIILDNKDRTLPELGDEIVLKRTVTTSTDVYTLDGQSTSRDKVMTLLELAGFFKANHFNIVNQDEIRAFMEVCSFSAEERLNMLSEIAGSISRKSLFNRISVAIDAKRAQSKKVSSRIKELQQEHFTLNERCMLNEQLRGFLSAKETHLISGEIKELKDSLKSDLEEKKKLEKDIEKAEMFLIQSIKHLEDLEAEEESKREALWYHEEAKEKMEKELKDDRTRSRLLQERIFIAQEELISARSDFKDAKSALSRIDSKDVVEGWQSVFSIVSEMKRNEKLKAFADQYRGLVIEQFKCPMVLMTAADAIAKNSLFLHVVDTDQAAKKILNQMKEKDLSASANFVTVDRLKRIGMDRAVLDFLASNDDAFEMMEHFRNESDVGMLVVVEQLFGRVVVCENLKTAFDIAQSTQLICTTCEGDVVWREGFVPGKNVSPYQTRFKLYHDYSSAHQNKFIQENNLLLLREELEDTESRISLKISELQLIENEICNFRTMIIHVQGLLKSVREDIASLRRSIEANQLMIIQSEFSMKFHEEKIPGFLLHGLEQSDSSKEELAQSLDDEICVDNQCLSSIHQEYLLLDAVKTDFDSQLADLMKLKEELDLYPSSKKLEEIKLKTIARLFKDVFNGIADPALKGFLGWMYDDDINDIVVEDLRDPDVSRLRGVTLKVNLDGESKNPARLLDEQKRIVSLALIFAVLRMDHTPFYILDHADMRLDRETRSNLAGLVADVSRDSQLIVATSHEELLEYADNIIALSSDTTRSNRALTVSKMEALKFIDPNHDDGDSLSDSDFMEMDDSELDGCELESDESSTS